MRVSALSRLVRHSPYSTAWQPVSCPVHASSIVSRHSPNDPREFLLAKAGVNILPPMNVERSCWKCQKWQCLTVCCRFQNPLFIFSTKWNQMLLILLHRNSLKNVRKCTRYSLGFNICSVKAGSRRIGKINAQVWALNIAYLNHTLTMQQRFTIPEVAGAWHAHYTQLYGALHSLRQQTVGPAVQPTDIPPPKRAALVFTPKPQVNRSQQWIS